LLLPVLLNAVGGDMQERSLSLLLRGRKLVSIAKEPPKKRAADHGVTAIYFVVEPNRDQLVEITKLVEDRKLRSMVDEIFPLADAAIGTRTWALRMGFTLASGSPSLSRRRLRHVRGHEGLAPGAELTRRRRPHP